MPHPHPADPAHPADRADPAHGRDRIEQPDRIDQPDRAAQPPRPRAASAVAAPNPRRARTPDPVRQTDADRAEQLQRVLAHLRARAVESGRGDLAERLTRASRALANTEVTVAVVGQFKQGKSALVNAIVAAPVCPVDDVLATAIPTVVRWGAEAAAELVTRGSDGRPLFRDRVDPGALRQQVTELADAGETGRTHAVVTLPSRVLAGGLRFIDTPGAGRAEAHAGTNLTLLPTADAALIVTDATQELTAPELRFVAHAARLCPRIVCVVSKTDMQLRWRDIATADRAHLAAAGIAAPVIATSAVLHDIARAAQDAPGRAAAGVDGLVAVLGGSVRGDVLRGRRRVAADEAGAVAEHLRLVLEAELRTLTAPDAPAARAAAGQLRRAESGAQQLADRSARWQQTLADGAGDLLSDIEYDLRDRLRSVGREAEQLIETSDPGTDWDDTGAWLAEAVTQAVAANYVWSHERSAHLADAVAQHFAVDRERAVPDFALPDTDGVIAAVGSLDGISRGRLSLGQKLMIGMKGSYGGVLMFGLMTTLAGMALVNPISIAAGLIMGGFAYRQDAAQRLEQRRAEAKVAVRKLIDEAIFQVSKESRDRIARVKRTLRDHFTQTAQELKQSLAESTRQAQAAAELPGAQRVDRAAHLRKRLAELAWLRARAETLVAGPAAAAAERSAS